MSARFFRTEHPFRDAFPRSPRSSSSTVDRPRQKRVALLACVPLVAVSGLSITVGRIYAVGVSLLSLSVYLFVYAAAGRLLMIGIGVHALFCCPREPILPI